jgi:hypothetical protein
MKFDLTEAEPEIAPQPLTPITSIPLPISAKPKKKANTKIASAKQFQKWIQRFIYRLQLPMSHRKLSTLDIGELRVICSMFKAYDGAAMRPASRNALVQFVAGRQNDPAEYKPIKKITGVKFPELEDQRYRELFESKLDPWRRPL